MPSKIPGGAPGPWQPTVRTPLLPSENAIFRTAVPFVRVPSSMLSTKPTLAWALAGCQLTRPVTLYVPLPPEVVVQVPPPSAADEPPPLAGATKCPDPVSVITSPPGAVAESWPPGLSGRGLALVAGLEHADAVEARRVRADGPARHLTPHGHQREAWELRGSCHEAVEVPLDGSVRRLRNREPELRERAYAVRPVATAVGDGRSRYRSSRDERAGRREDGKRAAESLHALPLSPLRDVLPLTALPVIVGLVPHLLRRTPAGRTRVEVALFEVDPPVATRDPCLVGC